MMDADPLACLPTLSQNLHERFSGPHTQYGSNCFYTLPSDGSMVHATVIVSCTQIFVCDPSSFVLRVALVEKLLALYQRTLGPDEREVMLVFEGEHDMLLRGTMQCEGTPQKPFVQTVKAMYTAHYPDVPFTVHLDVRDPLRDIAKLKIGSAYIAPMPMKEGDFTNCPCWRPGDVLNITAEEFARRVRNIFIVYAPEKLPTVPEVCRKYNKKRGGAIQFLLSKYGPEPSEEQARSVRAVQEREEKFNELLNPSANAGMGTTTLEDGTVIGNPGGGVGGGGSAVQLPQLMTAQKEKTMGDDHPLTFAQLLLSNRPSGGLGRVQVRITPVPFMRPQQPYAYYKRRPDTLNNTGAGGQFWYLCNEGYILAYETTDEILFDRFGYRCGDRLLATWGSTRGKWSTVVGVRDGALWVHDDGEMGASMLAGFESKEDLERSNGWMLGGKTSMRHVDKLCFYTHQGNKIWLHVNPEELNDNFGVFHGETFVPMEEHSWEERNDEKKTMTDQQQQQQADHKGNFIVIVGVEHESGALFAQQYENHRPAATQAGAATPGGGGKHRAATRAKAMGSDSYPTGWALGDVSQGLGAVANNSTSGEEIGSMVVAGGLDHVPVVRLDRCHSAADIARRYGYRSNGGSHIVRALPAVSL